MTESSNRPVLTPEQQALATRIHDQAIIIDGHCDILIPIADEQMRLGDRVDVPAEADWTPPQGMPIDPLGGLYNFSPHTAYFGTMGFYDIPRFLEGGLTSQAMSIYLKDQDLDRALQRAMDMTYWLYREAEDNDDFSVVTTAEEIRQVKASGKTSGFLTFEGFQPLGYDLKNLDLFARLGLRMGSLTHSRRNAFGDGGGQLGDPMTGGLTALGRQAVRRMNDLGIIVDLAHLNRRGSWDVVALSDAPIVLSHARTSRLSATSNHAADSDLRSERELWEAIAKSGGLVGIIGYSMGTVQEFVDNIVDTIAAIGPDHVGLGTDFYGYERAPIGFMGMHELPNVTAELVLRGIDEETILKVLGGNLMRIFEQVWQ